MQVKPPSSEADGKPTDASKDPKKQQRVSDPASEAGKTKVAFYQTNKWVVGYTGEGGQFVSQKHVLPQPLERAFIRSAKQVAVTDEYEYDKSKFKIDAFPDTRSIGPKDSRVLITSMAIAEKDPSYSVVAAVRFVDNEFIIKLVHRPSSGVYPFTVDELLQAVTSAKWQYQFFCTPEDGDSDSEDEAPKKV